MSSLPGRRSGCIVTASLVDGFWLQYGSLALNDATHVLIVLLRRKPYVQSRLNFGIAVPAVSNLNQTQFTKVG